MLDMKVSNIQIKISVIKTAGPRKFQSFAESKIGDIQQNFNGCSNVFVAV